MSLKVNLQKADDYLSRFKSERLPHFIGGRHDLGTSGRTLVNTTPTDGSRLGEFAAGGAGEIDAAAADAQRRCAGRHRARAAHAAPAQLRGAADAAGGTPVAALASAATRAEDSSILEIN